MRCGNGLIGVANEDKKVFEVLNYLIEQNPPSPSSEDFSSLNSEGDIIDQIAFSNALHKWRISYTHTLTKMAHYLFYMPNPNKDTEKLINDLILGVEESSVIEDFNFVSQVYLNVVQDSIRHLKRLKDTKHDNI